MHTKEVPFSNSNVTGGFWRERYETVQAVTVQAVLDRYKETGRIRALEMEWKAGDEQQPHIYWESDVTKWMEGVAYLIHKNDLPQWEDELDRLIEVMARTQDDNGYLNAYFTVVEPDQRFTRRVDHELYCAGHLIEAAVAYARASGKTKLLEVACKYADLIDETFRVKQSAAFDTCGHQEIELALFRLYEYTGELRYKLLAEYFIDTRGHSEKDVTYEGYDDIHVQSHLPVRDQKTAEGHAVRALYMFIAVADMARLNEDQELIQLCRIFYGNVINKRMYITGGVGSTYLGESFTYDYDLPSDTAYSETCASIALALFCRRLWLLDTDGLYADIAEQAIYNTVMGGLSIGGDRFFYENPLSADHENVRFYADRPRHLTKHLPILERAKVFSCSCCPPNLVRFVSSIADFMYTTDSDTVFTQCYMDAETELTVAGQQIKLEQTTEYPYQGRIILKIHTAGSFKLALRIPSWCRDYTLKLNDVPIAADAVRHYVYLDQGFSEGDTITLDLAMPHRLLEANPKVKALDGRLAVAKGPLIYCAEAFDNPGLNVHDIRIDPTADFKEQTIEIEGRVIPCLLTKAKLREAKQELYADYPIPETTHDVTLIPYFAWANRKENDMTTWFRR